jgi:hypothetical protein
METKGTVFYRRRVPAEKIVRGIASLCEGVGIWQVARISEVDANTVLGWELLVGHFLERSVKEIVFRVASSIWPLSIPTNCARMIGG